MNSEIYSLKNGFEIHDHSHGSYLATKTPLRKNKDYRARPRNYVVGFPIYKKDAYTRHWGNLNDDHAPATRYTKTYLKGFFIGSLLYGVSISSRNNLLNRTQEMQSLDYGNFSLVNNLKIFLKRTGKVGAAIGFFLTAHLFLTDYLQ